MKKLLYFFLLLIVVTSCRQKPKEPGPILIGSQEQATKDSALNYTEVFTTTEEMPSFPGGDPGLFKFIYDNIKYPELAKKNNIQGKVIVRFCVTDKGTVDHVAIVRGVDPSLDEEAIRVVKMLPLWKPGKQGGKPVNVWYSAPIIFSLKDNPYPKSSDKKDLSCKIYPNPAHDHINIRIEDQDIKVRFQIINAGGQIVATGQLNESIEQIDISELTNGIYILNLTTAENLRSSAQQFIKN
jgi:TonB family protein